MDHWVQNSDGYTAGNFACGGGSGKDQRIHPRTRTQEGNQSNSAGNSGERANSTWGANLPDRTVRGTGPGQSDRRTMGSGQKGLVRGTRRRAREDRKVG